MKPNKKELIDTRPQSVANKQFNKPRTLPAFKEKPSEKAKPIETKGIEKSVETGDCPEKAPVEIDLQSKINELTIKMEIILKENIIFKEKSDERSKFIEKMEHQIEDFKKDNNLLNLALKKLKENYCKEQDSNKKLTEKCKNYEHECTMNQEYLEAAKKMSDKKVKFFYKFP